MSMGMEDKKQPYPSERKKRRLIKWGSIAGGGVLAIILAVAGIKYYQHQKPDVSTFAKSSETKIKITVEPSKAAPANPTIPPGPTDKPISVPPLTEAEVAEARRLEAEKAEPAKAAAAKSEAAKADKLAMLEAAKNAEAAKAEAAKAKTAADPVHFDPVEIALKVMRLDAKATEAAREKANENGKEKAKAGPTHLPAKKSDDTQPKPKPEPPKGEPGVQKISAVSNGSSGPSSMQSLQPYRKFAKGEGEGIALVYKPRSKAELVALFRDKARAKKEMRVPCEVLVRQMAEAHGLPFEGCEGAAAAIEGDADYQAVACTDDMFRKNNLLTVTDQGGKEFGTWPRGCYPGEQVLVYKGKPLISLTCLNVAVPTAPQAPPAPVRQALETPPAVKPATREAITVYGGCPEVYTLKVNVWAPEALSLPGVAATAAKEELERRFVGTPHVSRAHGRQIRQAFAQGQVSRSSVPRQFRVSLIMTPEAQGGAPSITAEEAVGDFTITGLQELRFMKDQLEKWDAIRVIALDGSVISPPVSGDSGLHELRFFNHLRNTRLGEWDSNPQPDCLMNEHWIAQK